MTLTHDPDHPTFTPARSSIDTIPGDELRGGDVIYHHQLHTHIWITPNEEIEYINTPTIHTDVTLWSLQQDFENGVAELLNRDVESRENFSLTEEEAGEKYNADPSSIEVGGASSTGTLTVDALRGDGMVETANSFLTHPEVNYGHDPVTFNPKIVLAARNPRDELVAIAVVGTAQARMERRGVSNLFRFAAHPNRPENTGTWLLSRALEWARLNGFDEMKTFAGVTNGNRGVMYDACGFKYDGEKEASMDGWQSREGREASGEYHRVRWRKSLRENATSPVSSDSRDTDNRELSEWGASTVAENESLVTTREMYKVTDDHPDPRTGEWLLDDEVNTFLAENGRETLDRENVFAVFGLRSKGSLHAVAAVRDDTGEGSNNFESVTVDTLTVSDVEWPVNALRSFVADIYRWASLHGYETVNAVTERETACEVFRGMEQFEGDGEAWSAVTKDT